jgi:hypothetical protein
MEGSEIIITDGGASLDSSVCGVMETIKKSKNALSNNAKGIIKKCNYRKKRCRLVKYKKDLCWWSEHMSL